MVRLLCSVLLLLNTYTHAAERFEYYTDANEIYNICIQRNNVWCATAGGAVQWNSVDSTYQKYTQVEGITNYASNLTTVLVDSHDAVLHDVPGDYIFRHNGDSWDTITKHRSLKAYDMVESPTGELWFAHIPVFNDIHAVYVTHYDGTTWHEHEEFSELGIRATCLTVDNDNVVWVGSVLGEDGHGIASYNGHDWQRHTVKQGLIEDDILSIFVDRMNNKWFVSALGVGRFDGNEWLNYLLSDNPSYVDPFAITADSNDTIYVGVKKGIYQYKDNTWNYIPLVADYDGQVTDLACDDSDSIWCATFDGLYCYDGLTWTEYREHHDMQYNNVTFLHASADGAMWIGYKTSRPSKVALFGIDQWTNYNFSGGVHTISSNDLTTWITCSDTLYRYENDTIVSFPVGFTIHATSVDNEGVIWIGGWKGLYGFNGDKWDEYIETSPHRNPYFSGDIIDITVDNDNIKWLGTNAGVTSFDGESWLSYTTDDGLANNLVTNIEIADNGVIWCAHDDYGLSSFDGSSWTSHIESGGPTEEIHDIGSRGSFTWFATDHGVWQYNGTSWEHLIDNHVDEFAIDTAGRLWCDVGYGVKRYDGESWVTYTRENGLIWHEVTTIEAALDGSMWVGSEQGLTRIIPDTSTSITSQKPEPVVLLRNYPNPFNPSTTIKYYVPMTGNVTLAVYNIAGQKIHTLVSERMDQGYYVNRWDGRDESGREVSAGPYFARLQINNQISTQKMLLIK